MIFIDILAIIIIIYNAISGIKRGLLQIVFDLFGFYISTMIALRFSEPFSLKIQELINASLPHPKVIAFVAVWTVIFIAIMFFSTLLNRLFSFTIFSPFNRIGGLVLGALKGMCIVVPFLLPMVYFNLAFAESSLIVQSFRPQLEQMNQKLFTEENMSKIGTRVQSLGFLGSGNGQGGAENDSGLLNSVKTMFTNSGVDLGSVTGGAKGTLDEASPQVKELIEKLQSIQGSGGDDLKNILQ